VKIVTEIAMQHATCKLMFGIQEVNYEKM